MPNPIVAVRRVKSGDREHTVHYYWCPGCPGLHGVAIRPDTFDNGAGWIFTGTLERPTYAPSQLTTYGGDGSRRCHTFIRDGMIEFLSDCTHAMAGKTVPLPPLPDWMVGDEK